MLSSSVWRGKSRFYFAVGLCLGGLSTALLAVTMGSLLRPFLPEIGRIGVTAAVAVFVLAGEFGLHRLHLPHRRSQVPSTVIDEGSDHGAMRFGFEMGTGMRTFMPSNLPYLTLSAVVLLAAWPGALLAGLGFGLGRAWMALGRHYSGDANNWDRQWRRRERLLRMVLAGSAGAVLAASLLA